MLKTQSFFVSRIFILFLIMFDSEYCYGVGNSTKVDYPWKVPIGVVLDLNSALGNMANLCMEMAISDFYSINQNYETRLQLKTKNSSSVLDSHFAVLELLEQEQVQAILGPQGSKEETFVAEVGAKVHVPIISFTARTSSVSYTENPNFVRITQDDGIQAQALAAICKKFKWPQVVVLYEDTDYGDQFVSLLTKAFQDVDIRFAYMAAIRTLAEDNSILKELTDLKEKETKVFLVHMNPSLGCRLFTHAKEVGMMSEGFAWIVTDSLSNFMNSVDSVRRGLMEGVVGIRPYVPSENLESLERKMNLEKTTGLNVYGLWAYDAVTALAIAVEKIGPANSTLVNEFSRTNFRGLSGEFKLVDGKLKPSAFEIFNILESGEQRLGFWTPGGGIIGELSSVNNTKELKKAVIWPGYSFKVPKGWSIPANGILRVGIPWKYGFKEFANVTVDLETNHTSATGFSVDIFLAALEFLPFSIKHEFVCYNDTKNSTDYFSYNDMLSEIPQKFDMVVGDISIWAPRTNFVDFSQPYSESGVVQVVRNKKPLDMWIFIKPLKWDLWLAIIVACLLVGVVIYVLERRATRNSKDSAAGEKKERAGTIYWSSVAALAFPDGNMVSNKWSLFVLVFWLFMAFILMQSYTANLSAILTVDQLQFSFSDNYYVGYQKGSFVEQFLTEHLNINQSKLRSYSSVEEFHNAMSKGSKHGGIDAIFDEIPCMKLFLETYASEYKMVGPVYKTGGFGFAFPNGSPLTAYFSRAILHVTQGPDMTPIERKNFGPGYSSQDPLSSTISQGTSSLTFFQFAGLFIIVGSVTIFALFCSETPIGRKLTDITRHFIVHNCFCDKTSRVHPMDGNRVEGDSTHIIVMDQHGIELSPRAV